VPPEAMRAREAPSNFIYFLRFFDNIVPSFSINPGDTPELKNSDLIISI